MRLDSRPTRVKSEPNSCTVKDLDKDRDTGRKGKANDWENPGQAVSTSVERKQVN